MLGINWNFLHKLSQKEKANEKFIKPYRREKYDF